MKILTIFIDMLRPDTLNLISDKAKKGSLDEELIKIGGKIYRNCYTPTPDSPRSLACYFSGKYPHKNGCDRRIKYPGFFLAPDGKNILEVLEEAGFNLYFFNNLNEKRLGVLPPGFSARGVHNKDLNLRGFLQGITLKEHSFVYISLTDFHWMMDDFGYSPYFVKKGHKKVANALSIIRNNLNIDEFDYILVFSDHGFKMRRELKAEPVHKLLNKDRTNTFLLLKKKSDRGLTYDDKFCSVMDLYPTLCDIIGANVPDDLDGISLFSQKERKFLVAEDHTSFAPQVNQTINLWAVIKKNGIYYRTLDAHFFENREVFSESVDELDGIISRHSPVFPEYRKENEVLNYYRAMVLDRSFYTDGSKRILWPAKLKQITRRVISFLKF